MNANSALIFMFIPGAVIDGAIAVIWFLIASGWNIPNRLNGYTGTCQDYQLAMYIAAIFMAAWTQILAWGTIKPVERKALLLITSGLLLLSVIIEFAFISTLLGGAIFVFGVAIRCLLSALFISTYIYSLNKNSEQRHLTNASMGKLLP